MAYNIEDIRNAIELIDLGNMQKFGQLDRDMQRAAYQQRRVHGYTGKLSPDEIALGVRYMNSDPPRRKRATRKSAPAQPVAVQGFTPRTQGILEGFTPRTQGILDSLDNTLVGRFGPGRAVSLAAGEPSMAERLPRNVDISGILGNQVLVNPFLTGYPQQRNLPQPSLPLEQVAAKIKNPQTVQRIPSTSEVIQNALDAWRRRAVPRPAEPSGPVINEHYPDIYTGYQKPYPDYFQDDLREWLYGK